jgi:hypothetical protein
VPQSVGGNFYCGNNQLTSLEYAPQSVGGYFNCNNNQLTSLEGAPLSVGAFYCGGNPVESIWDLFKDYSQVDMLNDYDPVRDGGLVKNELLLFFATIILDRLNEFLEQIGKQPVTSVKGYKCI